MQKEGTKEGTIRKTNVWRGLLGDTHKSGNVEGRRRITLLSTGM
jgi:hypothetical protein